MTPQKQLDGFIARFEPKVARAAKQCVAKLRKQLPGATVLVYDNYNALAIAFGASEMQKDLVCSIAVYPRYASLFLMRGPVLDDPTGILEGSGTTVRHVKLVDGVKTLARPEVQAVLAQALDLAEPQIPKRGGVLVIRSVSKKQRPRR